MRTHDRRRLRVNPHLNPHGFTLVELLVVIGIIAVLIGVLLPVLSKARGRAETISCQANLRSITQACIQYTVEYRGSYPWGVAWNRNTPIGRPYPEPITLYITWFSSCDKYMSPHASELIPLDANSGYYDGATRRVFSKSFKCPAVPFNEFRQQVQYYNNGIIMPSIPLEWGKTPSGRAKVNSPAKVNQVFPDNALFWDSNCFSQAAAVTPWMFWGDDHTSSGFAPFVTMIDDNAAAMTTENGLLCHPEKPQRRYRPGPSRWLGDPLRESSGPIAWASDEYLTSLGFWASQNTDFGGGTVWNPGNARFRHNGLGCNVAFVDGSVQTFFLNPRKIVKGSTPQTYIYTDFKRYMLQMKWPNNGITDSGVD